MSRARRLVSKLDHLVEHARANVPLYREMYSGFGRLKSVEDFARLPILTQVILGSEKVKKTFGDVAQLCITRTFDDLPRVDGYTPRLLSYEDVLAEYEVLSFLLKPIDKRAKHKIMLVADESHTYTIAELGRQLAYYEWPLATFIIREQTTHQLRSYLRSYKPNVIFWDARQKLSSKVLPPSVRFLFSFNLSAKNKIDSTSNKSLKRLDIFRDTWLGPMAINDGGHNHYRFDPNYFYFELSLKGTLLVTSFIHRLQPVIRYELSQHGSLVSKNGFATE